LRSRYAVESRGLNEGRLELEIFDQNK
jgi:hypothetical protein